MKISNFSGFAASVLLAGLLLWGGSSVQAQSAADLAQKGSGPADSGQASPGYTPASTPSISQMRGAPDIVVIENIDFVPAPDFTGGSILWLDGSTCDCDTLPYNLNIYGTATTLQYFWPNNANGSEGGVSLDGGTTYAVLGMGDTIGPASTFLVGNATAATAAWAVPGNADGYLGFRFLDDGITKYGYAYVTTGPSGRPFTLHSVVYNNVGDPITIAPIVGSFEVGGTVTGLSGSGLVLQNNGGDDLPIAADGAFTFATPVNDGEDYAVTVLSQPENPSQTCSVTNGTGTISGADVNDVEVDCVTDTFTVGGTVTGLSGTGLVLQNNGGDDLSIAADGAFTFATALEDLSAYAVTVLSQPAGPIQTCVVSNDAGALAGADVTDVQVSCTSEPAALTLSTTNIELGPLTVGQQATASVTLTNTGIGELDITQVSDPGAPFALTGGSCLPVPVQLQPGESCVIEVTFAPGGNDLGEFQSSIDILSNADSSPDTITVSGTAGAAVSPIAVPVLGPLGLILLALMLAALAGVQRSRL